MSADDSLTSHIRLWACLRCEARVRLRTTRLVGAEHVASVACGYGCGRANRLVNVRDRVVEYRQNGDYTAVWPKCPVQIETRKPNVRLN